MSNFILYPPYSNPVIRGFMDFFKRIRDLSNLFVLAYIATNLIYYISIFQLAHVISFSF